MTATVTESELPFVARDGLPLTGTLFSPDERGGPARRPTVLVVHGYSSSRTSNIRLWGQGLARLGLPAFVIGNRGSDRSWTHGGRHYGGSHEWVDETPRDLRGAIDALRRRGHDRFILAGHSLGCVKVVYTQATSPIEDRGSIYAEGASGSYGCAERASGTSEAPRHQPAPDRHTAGHPDPRRPGRLRPPDQPRLRIVT